METIIIKERLSTTMRVDNSGDSERSYDIAARIQCSKEGVTSIFDGLVSIGGKTVGSFNNYGAELSINFVSDSDNGPVLSAVTQFINKVKSREYDI